MLEPYYQEPSITLYKGDCREVMAQLDADSIDTIITDPPYGLEFMGKDWDKAVPGPDFWEAAMRVCKPGAMMMAFGGTRLYHRMTCAIEDAGWEIRDCLMWLYSSGFPKSHDISKAIDKAAGAEREAIENPQAKKQTASIDTNDYGDYGHVTHITPTPATPEAALWDGWGTALKPAWEPIVLAMKPLDGTFAENALKHGVAGLNIDGGRIGTADTRQAAYKMTSKGLKGGGFGTGKMDYSRDGMAGSACGRFPANLMLDEDTAPMLDEQSGECKAGGKVTGKEASYSGEHGIYSPRGRQENSPFNDQGGASRFFYIAKPSKADRGHRPEVAMPLFDTVDKGFRNTHPTVKPTPLMQRLIILQTYLMSLTATPTGGVILDPFGGSGTTAIAAKKAARPCIIIERDEENLEIIKQRLKQL